jgi:signal transduction histidine kinase
MKEINVIFVDDDTNILHAIERQFANETYGVAVASNSTEALDIMSKNKIKVVLSDQRMPEMNGVDLLRWIKGLYPDVVRILFTGYADLNSTEKAINVGEVYRFINKPWDQEELKAVVEGAMRHYDLTIENRRLFQETAVKNKDLENANSRLKEFSSTLSHELRTPLASIKAGIDIVMSGTAGPLTADQKDFLKRAKDNIDRLNRLINNILDLAHLESGKSTLNLALNDINRSARSVAEGQKAVAKNKGLDLTVALDYDITPLMYDNDMILQVLNNLISNAIKFTQTGGIVVSTVNRPDAGIIEVRVKDTGPGISDKDMEKLFQKFQQLGDPAHRQVGGTGLGLAICREIIAQHGGKIMVESKVGEGSTFYFILPIGEKAAAV